MMGRVWMEKGDYAKAVESLERVIEQIKNWWVKPWRCCKPVTSS